LVKVTSLKTLQSERLCSSAQQTTMISFSTDHQHLSLFN